MLSECLNFYSSLLLQREEAPLDRRSEILGDLDQECVWLAAHYRLFQHVAGSSAALLDEDEGTVSKKTANDTMMDSAPLGLTEGLRMLITADDSFDLGSALKWFIRIQLLMDMLFVGGGGLLENDDAFLRQVFSDMQPYDMPVVQHVAVLAAETSLQAMKVWDICPIIKDSWFAAGDLLVLTMIRARNIKGLTIPYIQAATNEHARYALEDIVRTVLSDEEAETSRDVWRSIPMLLACFPSTALPAELGPLLNLWNTKHGFDSEALKEHLAVVESPDLSWSQKLVSAKIVAQQVESMPKCSLECMQQIEEICKWLILEFNAGSANEVRQECRNYVMESLGHYIRKVHVDGVWSRLQGNRTAVFVGQHWSDLVSVLCREWVLRNSREDDQSTPSRQPDASVSVEATWSLLTVIAEHAPLFALKTRQLMDDLYEQLVLSALGGECFGYPLFSIEAQSDWTRRSLVKRREHAQRYFALNKVEASCEGYKERYRQLLGGLDVNSILKAALKSSLSGHALIYKSLAKLNQADEELLRGLVANCLEYCVEVSKEIRRDVFIQWSRRAMEIRRGVVSYRAPIMSLWSLLKSSLEWLRLLHDLYPAVWCSMTELSYLLCRLVMEQDSLEEVDGVLQEVAKIGGPRMPLFEFDECRTVCVTALDVLRTCGWPEDAATEWLAALTTEPGEEADDGVEHEGDDLDPEALELQDFIDWAYADNVAQEDICCFVKGCFWDERLGCA